jgi:hypothetical protein
MPGHAVEDWAIAGGWVYHELPVQDALWSHYTALARVAAFARFSVLGSSLIGHD